MKRLILSLCIAMPVWAAPVVVETKLEWLIPSTRQNGDVLRPEELSGYELYYSVAGGASGVIPVSGGLTTKASAHIALEPRTEPYTVSWSISAVDKNNLKGVPSATTTTTSVALKPASNYLACMIDNAKLQLKLYACGR